MRKFQEEKFRTSRDWFMRLKKSRLSLSNLEDELPQSSGEGWGRGEGTVREFGMDRYTKLYLK